MGDSTVKGEVLEKFERATKSLPNIAPVRELSGAVVRSIHGSKFANRREPPRTVYGVRSHTHGDARMRRISCVRKVCVFGVLVEY